jgi:hypothetical protein
MFVVDVNQVGHSVPVHITDKHSLRIITEGESWAVTHRHWPSEVPMPKIRPILHLSVVNENNV